MEVPPPGRETLLMRPIRPHLLVVDDDPCIREGLALALAGTYLVHEAATGHEACRALESHPIRAIVLDAVLHDEDGIDLIPRLLATAPTPIVLLTGYGTEELAVRAFRNGVQDYVKKPPNLDDLQTRLARLVPPAAQPLDPAAQLRRHLREHLSKDLDLAALAGEYGLGEAHLRRRFRKAYGQTPRQFVTEVRLERAAHLLRSTGRTVEEIGQMVGYPDALRFARVFKRRFALPPSEFRVLERLSQQDPS